MTIIDKIVFSQNAPAKNTLWARPSGKGTELLIFNKGKWGIVGADDFQRFHYEVYPSLEDITEPKPNALYLIGPKGEGEDKYDEYVYTEEGFTKIGDTSIDLSGYYTSQQTDSAITTALNTVLADYTTTSALTLLLAAKQDVISDLATIRSGARAGATAYQKPQGGIPSTDMSQAVQTSLSKADSALQQHQDISGKEDMTTIVAPVNATDATLPVTSLTCEVGKYYRIDVPVETLAVTLPAMGVVTSIKTVVIYLTGGTTPAVTITSADSKDVYYQDGYEIEAGKTYEVNALFNGSAWIIASVEIVIPPFFAKLSLNNGEVVELQGSGELTSAMVSPYKISIVSAEIGELCTSIGNQAFEYCSDLTSITIPNTVTSIGQSAFSRCSGLTSVTIGNGVTSIGDGAFYVCTGLTSITIPNGVTSIGNSVFQSCAGLTSVTIPDSVTSIDSGAFYCCTGLTSVTIGSGVTSIGDGAFYCCTGLTSITSLAAKAPTIQSGTFQDVKTNGTLIVPSGSTGYERWMGTDNFYLGKYNWTKVEQPTNEGE